MKRDEFFDEYKRQLKEKFGLSHTDDQIEKSYQDFTKLAQDFGVEGKLEFAMNCDEVSVLFDPRWDQRIFPDKTESNTPKRNELTDPDTPFTERISLPPKAKLEVDRSSRRKSKRSSETELAKG
jgi:hypothetical protein